MKRSVNTDTSIIQNREEHLLLYDGVCNLCNGWVQFIIKKDRKAKFRFSSLQSEAARDILAAFGLQASDFDSVVYIHAGKYYLRSTAVLLVLRELGGGWRLFYVFRIVPRSLRDFVYNIVAKTRYRIFGKRETCMVPTEALKQRFLDP